MIGFWPESAPLLWLNILQTIICLELAIQEPASFNPGDVKVHQGACC